MNTDDELVEASPETLRKLLEALSGERVSGPGDLEELIRIARRKKLERKIEPVHVMWDGACRKGIPVYLPEACLKRPLRWTIALETGDVRQEEARDLAPDRIRRLDDTVYGRVWLPIRHKLPTGYHRITIETDGADASALILSAPMRVGAGVPDTGEKRWGVFSPLYGIMSGRDWGIGDVTEMEKAQEFTSDFGGSFFGTLPMLPISCDSTDCDPSPYSPVSRLFWNEIYLDVPQLIEESASARARAMTEEPSFEGKILRYRATRHVDYGSVFQTKKDVLEILSQEFFDSGAHHLPEYKDFIARVPEVEDYAEFRARGDEKERRYHLYVQFQMDKSLKRLNDRANRGEIAGLYLDFPVGVSRSGFDSERFASSFLEEANAGAPPDQLFIGGQDWGFAPLHPVRLREQGYGYFIKCIRHHMKYASVLRLDHIMAFHRIYAVPKGMSPKEGAYLKYKADEFFALLSIEAERSNVRVVGEDLGTVPREVRDELERHDCLRMWVLPFEAADAPGEAVKNAPAGSLACLNTHDMAPFAGFWSSEDIGILDDLGLLDEETKRGMAADREKTIQLWKENLGFAGKKSIANELRTAAGAVERAVAEKVMLLLASSPAELLLINIEDLWGENEPQNVPGTWKEYPNWRRKLSVRVEDWAKDPRVMELLKSITKARLESGRGTNRERTGGTGTDSKKGAERTDDTDSGRSPSL